IVPFCLHVNKQISRSESTNLKGCPHTFGDVLYTKHRKITCFCLHWALNYCDNLLNTSFFFAALIQSVRMEMTGEVVSCSSENIYPAPEVAWSTDPLSGPETLQNSTVKTPDSKGLYILESRVRILGNVFDYAYFCSVISADKAQVWTTSIKKTEELIGEAGRELSIPCIAPQNLQNFSLTWTFTRTNDPTVILSYDSSTRRTSNLWEGSAGLEKDQVLMSKGSLLLHNPESEEHSGTYTCTFTGFQRRHMVQTQVNITARRPTAGVTNVMADHMLWMIPAVSTLLWQSLWNYIH
uniref:Ig-like domain-containing protein n=1 Tax=Oncorhynchus mykiss TaxID=8022 RepID=A0A8C7UQW4_ONCMY